MRLWVQLSPIIILSPRFSRAICSAPDTPDIEVLCCCPSPIAGWSNSRVWNHIKKKRNLSLGLQLASRSSFVLPQIELSGPQCRNINLLPFHVSVNGIPCGIITLFLKLLRHLGLTNPCPNAVHMEPFSTSVFKVLIWIFATTTKICTNGSSVQDHSQRFLHFHHAFLLFAADIAAAKVWYKSRA